MPYRIISPRIGTPGELWEPEVWVNVHALVKVGFLESTDTKPTQAKPAKAKVTKKAAPDATSAQE
jgi:hypothetical protein